MAAPPLLLRDTAPEVRRLVVERWRATPSWRKAELVAALSRDCETVALVGIRERHPDASQRETRLRLGALRIPRELMIAAFGWDPRTQGF